MDGQITLAARRKALGLSQTELAEILGVTQATVSRNESAEAPDNRFVLSLMAIELQRRETDRVAA